MQGAHVLLDGDFLDFLQGRRFERGADAQIRAIALLSELQFGLIAQQDVTRLAACLFVAETDDDALAFAVDAAVANVLVTHQAAQIGSGRIQAFGQRTLHVDLQQEVHTTAQIQPQIHRQGMQIGQPLGRTGKQVEGHDVLRVAGVRIELLFEDVLGLELDVGVCKTHLDTIHIQENPVVFNARRLERGFDAFECFEIDLERGFAAGNLDSR